MLDVFDELFRFSLLLVFSGIILLGFYISNLIRYQVAWYLSLSAPGLLLLPLFVMISLSDYLPGWERGAIAFVRGAPLLFLIVPSLWVLPAIFVFQLQNLWRRRLLPMNIRSGIYCVAIVGLYVWCDFYAAFDRVYTAN